MLRSRSGRRRNGLSAVEHELVAGEADLARFVVEDRRVVDEVLPRRSRVDVDLDDAGIGRHLQALEARVARRWIALEAHLRAERGGGVFDRGDQVEVLLEQAARRHEHVQDAVARLDAQRGAREIRRRLAARGRVRRRRHHRRRRPRELAARRQGRALAHRIALPHARAIVRRRPRQRVER
jgi:hypothetical protein